MIWLLVTVLYISPLIGDGSDANPYRTALGSYAIGNGISCIPSLPNGKPRKAWSLDRVKLSSTVDASFVQFPLKNLDESMTLTAGQWGVLNAALAAKGISTTGLTKDSTLRQLANAVLTGMGCPNFLDGVIP